MANNDLSKLDRETTGLKLFPLFTLLGWLLIGAAIIILATTVSPTAAGYWGNAKQARDAAAVGSALLAQLSTLASYDKLLPPLIFLGVSSFMLAIAMGFSSIPAILDRRIEVLKQAVPLMGK
ncbi:MAG: hypothetical protein GY796_23350 [Chloroflexi bacterium]|nr:hypothetical protein [Chloroflexota bacterium]